MAVQGFIGPVQLRDPALRQGNKEFTAPQVGLVPLYDSRLTSRFRNYLPPRRVRELRRDPTISLMRDVVLAPMVHTEWSIVATDNAPAEAKEFIEEVIFPLRLRWLQQSVFGAIDFGWAPFETVKQAKDGFIKYTKFKPLLQDYSWAMVYIDTGAFAGVLNAPMGYESTFMETYLDETESMIINFEVEGTDWYGDSIFQDLDATQDDWIDSNNSAIRYNSKVAGAHWVIYFPPGQTMFNEELTDNQVIAKRVLYTLEANGAVIIPDEIQNFLNSDAIDNETRGKWRVELLSDTSNAQVTFTDRQKYLDSLKVRAFGVPERGVLEGQFGTKAEAEVHSDIALATIDTKHRVIVDQLNRYAVRDLMKMNFGEDVQDTVKILVAPLVDSRFAVLKETFRLLMQGQNTVDDVLPKLDLSTMMEELSLPKNNDQEEDEAAAEINQKRAERIRITNTAFPPPRGS